MKKPVHIDFDFYIDLLITFAEKVHLCFISICRKKKVNGFLKICCFVVSQFISTPTMYMYVVEWSRALDVRLSEWCCSVSMVWVQIPSREEQKFDGSKI
jgi:hypothetical protein